MLEEMKIRQCWNLRRLQTMLEDMKISDSVGKILSITVERTITSEKNIPLAIFSQLECVLEDTEDSVEDIS